MNQEKIMEVPTNGGLKPEGMAERIIVRQMVHTFRHSRAPNHSKKPHGTALRQPSIQVPGHTSQVLTRRSSRRKNRAAELNRYVR